MGLGGFVEVKGPQGTRLVELTSDRATLGRATTNDVVVLLDATVSRLHAVIERYPTGFCVRDLGSANGTFVNGEPVRGETRLRTGDELRLGSSRLTFFAVGDDDSEITAVADGPPVLTRRERDLLLALCRPLLEGAAFAPPAGIRQMATELYVSCPSTRTVPRRGGSPWPAKPSAAGPSPSLTSAPPATDAPSPPLRLPHRGRTRRGIGSEVRVGRRLNRSAPSGSAWWRHRRRTGRRARACDRSWPAAAAGPVR